MESAAADITAATLPSWLVPSAAREPYEPPRDHDSFLRKNALRLTALLAAVRVGGTAGVAAGTAGATAATTAAAATAPTATPASNRPSLADLAMARVPAPLRIAGLLVALVCITSATNAAFLWILLAGLLVVLALRPARLIGPVVGPALVGVGASVVVMLPAAIMGLSPADAVVRMATRVFLSVALVVNVSQNVPWNRLVGALGFWHLPGTVVFVLDTALHYLSLLGEVAASLSEALALRSVGSNAEKSRSASGVMGVTFVRSHQLSAEMSEAMECRGFDGAYVVPPERVATAAGAGYFVAVVLLVALFVWLELAMRA